MTQWPASWPPFVWSTSNLGAGYGSIAVKGARIFVQGMKGRESTVSSLNRTDGEIVWSTGLGSASRSNYGPGGRNGGIVALDKMSGATI